MCRNMFHLKDLTNEEKELLGDPDKVLKILFDPLAYLVKHEVRDDQAHEARGNYSRFEPGLSNLVDNSN